MRGESMDFEAALGIVRRLIDAEIPRDEAIENPAIPEEYREGIREALEREDTITLESARTLTAENSGGGWLRDADRSDWYYWPTLRRFLLDEKQWGTPVVRSLDKTTDFILGQLAPPQTDQFDIRGLVLGYVQSGKTANYTALIAKAADVGYRLIIVLAGTDNGLRRQTQLRLKRELVGYPDGRSGAVRLPPKGLWWHEFTRDDIDGDFQPGFANYATLQGSQPVLLVIKKIGPILRRLLRWLDYAPAEARRSTPLLVIDDEADQASIDTRGTYQTEDDPPDTDYEDPSVTNGLIRRILRKFQRSAYVAYTATPFANILIPHDAYLPDYDADLYPKDFIIDLPKPPGYFGAEELFGISDDPDSERSDGLDVLRIIPDTDTDLISAGGFPPSLTRALMDFVLAGAARAQRGQDDQPATMLVHTSHLIVEQNQLAGCIEERFQELRDEWRYQRNYGIRERLHGRWEAEFRPVIRANHIELDMPFEEIEQYIGPFFESVNVRAINSNTGDVLDYEHERGLKAIAVGGNRLSRGLTLEGLTISYFVRRSSMYDTLMQMGRWFGFREGYEDLTRLYMPQEIANWFSSLAFVEYQLRQDLQIYQDRGLTPLEFGMRIWQHPALQVTNRLKRRYTQTITTAESYAGTRAQTFRFPFSQPDLLAEQEDNNLEAVREFLSNLDDPVWDDKGPIWSDVPVLKVLHFLQKFRTERESGIFATHLICSYIERLMSQGELIRWTVAVRGLKSENPALGEAEWGVPGGHIWQIQRTRLGETDTLGVITNPGDEAVGLSEETLGKMEQMIQEGIKKDIAARHSRPPEEGLLLLYPISKNSRPDPRRKDGTRQERISRVPLYDDPDDSRARDLIGVAISFPPSNQSQRIENYTVGTMGWGQI